jgi:DNA-binding NtrC family response regulator
MVPAGVRKTIAEVAAEQIRRVFERTGGNRTLTAQILGISRVGLLSKIKRYGIDVKPRPGTAPEESKGADFTPSGPRPAR